MYWLLFFVNLLIVILVGKLKVESFNVLSILSITTFASSIFNGLEAHEKRDNDNKQIKEVLFMCDISLLLSIFKYSITSLKKVKATKKRYYLDLMVNLMIKRVKRTNETF